MPKRSKVSLRAAAHRPDYLFVGLVLCLTLIGIIMVGNASAAQAYQDFGDNLHFLKLQTRWALVGLVAFLVACKLDYHRLTKFTVPLLGVSIFTLLLVLIPGVGTRVLGARRWIALPGMSFQPAELIKFTFTLYLASFFSKRKEVLPFLALTSLIVFLIMLEPDLGTTLVVVFTGFSVYFAAGLPIWQMTLVGLSGSLIGLGLILTSTYRRARLLTFLNPEQDPLGASYHINQVLLALGSGGLFGLGLGQSRQKYQYLPEVSTDSIFAIIAEETGFVGGVVLISLFLILIWRGLRIAKRAPDEFSRLLAVGFTCWIGIQAFINLSAMVALLPLTGIPLPFISYGGSSLVLLLFGAGILVNISGKGLS